jgi:hypothetical protein
MPGIASQTAEATYEGNVLRLNHPLSLDDQQRVLVVVMPMPDLALATEEVLPPEEVLRLAAQVYEGLSPDDVDEVERIALDRSHFFNGRE